MKNENNKNRFLYFSIILLILNQSISNVFCVPNTQTTEPNLDLIEADKQKEQAFGELSGNEDLNFDNIDNLEDDEQIEQIIERDTNSNETNSNKNTFDIHSSINTTDDEDEHSEIENLTTLTPLFDNPNITLPSLSRMIDLKEQGEFDILNNSQTRRILIDLNSNEEIIGPNDIDKLFIDNDLNLDNEFIESDTLRSPDEECGRNRFGNEVLLTERIMGGNDTMPGEIPWMVSIRLKHPNIGQVGHWCGGVLINKNWVVSAAHCLINPLFHLPDPVFWQVRLGKHNIRKNEGTEKTYQVVKLFLTKNYRSYDNDLALLKFESEIEEDEFIKPICLPLNDQFDFSNSECWSVGWGKNDYLINKKGSDLLQKVKVNVYDNFDCHKVYYPKFKISIKNWHLCAGNKLGGKGTCHGDSGGPLQCRFRNRWFLAGITSFGSNCAKPNFPDVYTKIIYFLNWIKEKIKKE